MSGSGKGVLATPFYHRNYGGFTPEQQEFADGFLLTASGLTVLDPMGGQGYLIYGLVRKQGTVWLGDANPAPLLLATLRDPELVLKHERLRSYILDKIHPLRTTKTSVAHRSRWVDEWIAPSVRDDLVLYSDIFHLKRYGDLLAKSSLWGAGPYHKFAACLPILCARSLTCFHMSDNATWPVPGGVPQTNTYKIIVNALDQWCEYAKALQVEAARSSGEWGTLKTTFMNVELGDFGGAPSPHAIITSPPYANRLDYTRLWAPELQLVSVMFGTDPDRVKRAQIGTTVVEGMNVESLEAEELPKEVRRALAKIRSNENGKASESYYYPFFLNYAVRAKRALLNMAKKLRSSGILIVFVRDTARKDTILPTGTLVERVLADVCQLKLLKKEGRIIRSHVGLVRRKKNGTRVRDLAQQEWWMAFRNSEK